MNNFTVIPVQEGFLKNRESYKMAEFPGTVKGGARKKQIPSEERHVKFVDIHTGFGLLIIHTYRSPL